jgi:glycosyltransferase involved in cell wall biosynthesis
MKTPRPEREALGLNVLEAQACGTPVIAVDGGPFVETVLHGETGWLYGDPQQDGGESFRALISSLAISPARLDPRDRADHLQRFSADTFARRVDRIFRETLLVNHS